MIVFWLGMAAGGSHRICGGGCLSDPGGLTADLTRTREAYARGDGQKITTGSNDRPPGWAWPPRTYRGTRLAWLAGLPNGRAGSCVRLLDLLHCLLWGAVVWWDEKSNKAPPLWRTRRRRPAPKDWLYHLFMEERGLGMALKGTRSILERYFKTRVDRAPCACVVFSWRWQASVALEWLGLPRFRGSLVD